MGQKTGQPGTGEALPQLSTYEQPWVRIRSAPTHYSAPSPPVRITHLIHLMCTFPCLFVFRSLTVRGQQQVRGRGQLDVLQRGVLDGRRAAVGAAGAKTCAGSN